MDKSELANNLGPKLCDKKCLQNHISHSLCHFAVP